jgi:hypothetical protein
MLVVVYFGTGPSIANPRDRDKRHPSLPLSGPSLTASEAPWRELDLNLVFAGRQFDTK